MSRRSSRGRAAASARRRHRRRRRDQPPPLPLPLVVGLHARFAVPYGALRATKSKRRSQAVACNRESCSCLLRPLLPALAAPSVAALLALAVLVVGRECVAGAEGEGSRCEAVREVDLGADRVGEVGNDEDVLDVCVAADVSMDGGRSEQDLGATYKSRSMSAASTLGARLRAFMRNWPRADEGWASSSRTLLT